MPSGAFAISNKRNIVVYLVGESIQNSKKYFLKNMHILRKDTKGSKYLITNYFVIQTFIS